MVSFRTLEMNMPGTNAFIVQAMRNHEWKLKCNLYERTMSAK